MSYYPEGWSSFAFLVTPEELGDLLSGFHQVTFCARVPKGYVESPSETLIAPWRCLYEKLQGSAPVDSKKDRDCFIWADGLTDDLKKCRYAAPFQDQHTGEWFQLTDFTEPCVGLRPFPMAIGEDGKLYTRLSYLQSPQLIVGLELQYPKKIAYFNEARTGYSRVVPCEETETYLRVYEPLLQRVKAITASLRFSVGGKDYHPRVRISPPAKKDFPRFWFAREYQIQLK